MATNKRGNPRPPKPSQTAPPPANSSSAYQISEDDLAGGMPGLATKFGVPFNDLVSANDGFSGSLARGSFINVPPTGGIGGKNYDYLRGSPNPEAGSVSRPAPKGLTLWQNVQNAFRILGGGSPLDFQGNVQSPEYNLPISGVRGSLIESERPATPNIGPHVNARQVGPEGGTSVVQTGFGETKYNIPNLNQPFQGARATTQYDRPIGPPISPQAAEAQRLTGLAQQITGPTPNQAGYQRVNAPQINEAIAADPATLSAFLNKNNLAGVYSQFANAKTQADLPQTLDTVAAYQLGLYKDPNFHANYKLTSSGYVLIPQTTAEQQAYQAQAVNRFLKHRARAGTRPGVAAATPDNAAGTASTVLQLRVGSG